ncbi:MAG: hypothetical protein FWE69_01170 [Clostridiales bacterium]|nr:hypothetical protein [Clostridiales bacterium]
MDFETIIILSVFTTLLLVPLNFGLLKSTRKLKQIDHNAEAKRFRKKWTMIHFIDIPLFLLTGLVSSIWLPAFSFDIGFLALFVYLPIVQLTEAAQRRKLIAQLTGDDRWVMTGRFE